MKDININLILIILFFIFSCSSSNSDIEQNIITKPELTTKSILKITQNSAFSGGTIISDGGATITNKGVCWSTEPNPTIANNITEDGSGIGEFSSNLNELIPNTEYFIRAYATNSKGVSYGNELSFITPKLIFEGDIVFLTQEEVNNFGDFEYNEVTGNITIGDVNIASTKTITDLEGLKQLTNIDGDLTLHANDALDNIDGLRNLTIVGGSIFFSSNKALTNLNGLIMLNSIGKNFRIVQNEVLTNIDGLINLTEINGFLLIYNNDNLLNIDGLDNVTSIGFDIGIFRNDALTEIDGLNNLTYATGLSISDNSVLSTINGFNKLASIDLFLSIENNDALISFNGLSEITSVGSNVEIKNNASLNNIDGLSKLTSFNGVLDIINNTNLNNLCGINLLINNGFTGTYNVSNNGYNPSEQEIINGNCTND